MNLSKWITCLKENQSINEAAQFFVKTAPQDMLYFEYNTERAWLTLKHTNIKKLTPGHIVRLYESEPSFNPAMLYNPQTIPTLHKNIAQHLASQHYECLFIAFNKQIVSFFACPAGPPPPTQTKDNQPPAPAGTQPFKTHVIKERFFILNSYIQNLLWEQQDLKNQTTDPSTGCLNKKAFLKTLWTEVPRARRLLLPVSVIAFSVDQFNTLESAYGEYHIEIFFKALSNNIQKDMRAYDTLGRLSSCQLALILPHTSEPSAGKQAEKIRWIVQSSDFSKVFPTQSRLTLSLGLAEYPHSGRAADDVLKYALKALAFAEQEGGGNMTAVASPPQGFKPDFVVPDKQHDLIRDLT